jgi:hypothetical protein
MDAQDFRSLQEAYNKVHQLDEISSELAKRAGEDRMNRTFALMQKDWKEGRKKPSSEFQKSYKKQQDDERRYRRKLKKEQVDIYDIILTHLLDEGYADTEQAAEAIMVNMSEEWRESICEAEIEPPKERVGALTNIDIPQNEREAARQRTLAKAKEKREKKKN